MDELKEQAIEAGIMLTNTLAKNTAGWVSTKIAQVKKKNEVEEIHKQYEEIINRLLEDNFELQRIRSEEHTSELQSRGHLVCRLLLEKTKKTKKATTCRKKRQSPEKTAEYGYKEIR